jgi:hypothetical protein
MASLHVGFTRLPIDPRTLARQQGRMMLLTKSTGRLCDLSSLPRMITQSFLRQVLAMRLAANFGPRKAGNGPR